MTGHEYRRPIDVRPQTVRVLPDAPAIDKAFDYRVPESFPAVEIGDRVRVALGPRRLGGWVVGLDPETPDGVEPAALSTWSGRGPSAEVIDLARWAAWRWGGRAAHLLTTASPERVVRGLPVSSRSTGPPPTAVAGEWADVVAAAAAGGDAVVRLPPSADAAPLVVAAASGGPVLVVCPSVSGAKALAVTLKRTGLTVALLPDGWAQAAGGVDVVVGSRAAAWGPCPGVATIAVLDEHDEAHQGEQAPTWHARDVALERARRAGARCWLVSPCPSVEALAVAPLVAPPRTAERGGWPLIDVVDRRRDDPSRSGPLSDALAAASRRTVGAGGRVVCVVNRRGRSALLACDACRELTRCEPCGGPVNQADDGRLQCGRCSTVRPRICQACGGVLLRNLKPGTTRLAEELAALLKVEVGEVSGPTADDPGTPVVVGTEAALHRVGGARLVAFLDFDTELLAPRTRAAEQAMSLLVRAARLVGPRAGGGRVLVQTSLPGHEVVQAALLADPSRLAAAESARRRLLRWPPFGAVALVSGAGAEAFAGGVAALGSVTVLGPTAGRWLVQAPDPVALADALAAVPRPKARLRVEVDPQRSI